MKARAYTLTIGISLALLAPAAHATDQLYLRPVTNHTPATPKTTKKTNDPLPANHYQVFRNTWGFAAI
jgi:hypothetical protein